MHGYSAFSRERALCVSVSCAPHSAAGEVAAAVHAAAELFAAAGPVRLSLLDRALWPQGSLYVSVFLSLFLFFFPRLLSASL